MALNLNKKRLERSKASTTMGGKWGKLKDGKNTIRVFTFSHTVTRDDFRRGLYREVDGIKEGETFDELDREIIRHFTEEGQVNCSLHDCKYCGESAILLDSKSKQDQRAGKDLSASKAFCINAVDMDSFPLACKIFTLPQTVFKEILTYIEHPEYGEAVLGYTGRDFIIDRDSKAAKPMDMYKVKIRDEKHCKEIVEDMETFDLFVETSMEPGYSNNNDLNSAEETPAPAPEKKTRRQAAPAPAPAPAPVPAGYRGSPNIPGPVASNKRNPFRDATPAPAPVENENLAPWESFVVGDEVLFTLDGKEVQGKIEDHDKEQTEFGVNVGGDIYDVKKEDLKKTPIASPAARARRR